ncbi:diaminopimelate epimerase [Sulfurivirga caldicuralii]|uniref:Diaminopimelate epimerase n=1 Tax=Sulfurivirga caldicuralii TaxID=364032 RepID=A0A1N6GH96_9GAMM|nr:diaminopimelate epimerase [Sulfurivirga caldicuralii]SIO06876.1 diaminopimelate epimerase [Sulfurivirga caldicuralii]
MGLKFAKMHGLGNDFMVVDAISQSFAPDAQTVRRLADRHFGVGFDQLLLVEKPTREDVLFRYRIFNADGSEVQNCGNGARCFARFVYDRGLTDQREIPVETAAGKLVLYIEDDGWVRVNMGQPRFAPHALPFDVPTEQARYDLEVLGQTVEIGAVSLGNPHAMLRVSSVNDAPVEQLGPAIESHPQFPERVNVGFAEVVDRQHVKLRVYERGAGETLACGTGATAAMVMLRRWGLVDDEVTVSLPGGDLRIRWSGDPQEPVWMSGPAEWVFTGELCDAN